jgi:hypothetical protein
MSKKAKTKAITLLIEAHGDEILDIEINVPYVHLLSFSGRMGQLGDFGKVGDESLELHILESLRNLYLGKSSAQQQSNVYNGDKLRAQLRTLYEEKAGKGYPSGGFFKTNPVRERTFYFKPNRHEDCRRCRKAKKLVEYSDGSMGPNPEYARVCVPNRKISSRDCPVYGLIVVASSDPDDKQFTLEGETGEGFDALSSANLHMNGGAELHWFQKIDGIKFPQASSAFEHMIEKLDISLTQLSKIFEAMGYTDIYILDPSCRSTKKLDRPDEQSKLKTAVHTLWERTGRGRKESSPSITKLVTWARPLPSSEEPEPEIIDETTDMEVSESCLLLDAACLASGVTAAHKVSGLGISPAIAAGVGTSAGILARDAGKYLKKDKKGRTFSCNVADGVCVLLGSAAGFGAQNILGAPSAVASHVGTTTGLGARKLIQDKLGFGGRKSKKQKKNKNKKTKKRRNKTRK